MSEPLDVIAHNRAAWDRQVAAGNDASTLAKTDIDVVLKQFDKLKPNIAKWWGSGAEA